MAFAVNRTRAVSSQSVISRIIIGLRRRKFALLLVITFIFMEIFGAFIPDLSRRLSRSCGSHSFSLGWDSLVGLGMSILATNVGFSMAVFNPFTIGVSQKLAGLPLFSGALPRLAISRQDTPFWRCSCGLCQEDRPAPRSQPGLPGGPE